MAPGLTQAGWKAPGAVFSLGNQWTFQILRFTEDFKQKLESSVEKKQTNVNREVRKRSQGFFQFHPRMNAIDVRTGTICPKVSHFRALLM